MSLTWLHTRIAVSAVVLGLSATAACSGARAQTSGPTAHPSATAHPSTSVRTGAGRLGLTAIGSILYVGWSGPSRTGTAAALNLEWTADGGRTLTTLATGESIAPGEGPALDNDGHGVFIAWTDGAHTLNLAYYDDTKLTCRTAFNGMTSLCRTETRFWCDRRLCLTAPPLVGLRGVDRDGVSAQPPGARDARGGGAQRRGLDGGSPRPAARERGAAPPDRQGPHEPADRAWFAALSALIPRARWAAVFPATPATLLSRHRRLVAGKYTPARRAPGRPSTRPAVKALILAMAQDNPSWGHRRIQGEPAKPGHRIAYATVWQILTAARIDPAPRRSGPTWQQILTTQARTMIATDFFSIATVLPQRLYVLVSIEHHTRRLHIAGITANPDAAWTAQQARNPAMNMSARLEDMRLLIRDHGGQFTAQFDAVFEDCGLQILKSPPQAAPGELDLRTDDQDTTPRTARPDPDHRPGTPAHRPGRIRPPLQHGAPASRHRPTRPARRPRPASHHRRQPGHRPDPPKIRPRRPHKRASDSCLKTARSHRPDARIAFPCGTTGCPAGLRAAGVRRGGVR